MSESHPGAMLTMSCFTSGSSACAPGAAKSPATKTAQRKKKHFITASMLRLVTPRKLGEALIALL